MGSSMEEKLQYILATYCCNDPLREFCDGDCEQCIADLEQDLRELVDLVKEN